MTRAEVERREADSVEAGRLAVCSEFSEFSDALRMRVGVPLRDARESRPCDGLREGSRGRVDAVEGRREDEGRRGDDAVCRRGDLVWFAVCEARDSSLSDCVRPPSSSSLATFDRRRVAW